MSTPNATTALRRGLTLAGVTAATLAAVTVGTAAAHAAPNDECPGPDIANGPPLKGTQAQMTPRDPNYGKRYATQVTFKPGGMAEWSVDTIGSGTDPYTVWDAGTPGNVRNTIDIMPLSGPVYMLRLSAPGNLVCDPAGHVIQARAQTFLPGKSRDTDRMLDTTASDPLRA